jgi:hypothetical protein
VNSMAILADMMCDCIPSVGTNKDQINEDEQSCLSEAPEDRGQWPVPCLADTAGREAGSLVRRKRGSRMA